VAFHLWVVPFSRYVQNHRFDKYKPANGERTMKELFSKPKVIAIIVVSVLALIVLLQNLQTVTFRLFFWKVEVSQLLLVLLMLVVGYILGFLTAKLTEKAD
jgi:uncharacterized integral membrane protein